MGVSPLTDFEIKKLVYTYIGVEGGYLGDFSYRSHAEFYIELGLDIDPYQFDGTTRQRFMTILAESPPNVQARILEGVLIRYPVGSSDMCTQEKHDEIAEWVSRLRRYSPEGASPVKPPSPTLANETVQRALVDAEHLLNESGATSAVDRVHTALHGYLAHLCDEEGVPRNHGASLTDLFGSLRQSHRGFANEGAWAKAVTSMLRGIGRILDAMNEVRNQASLAHPNTDLLPEPEAMLVINAARSIFHYFQSKTRAGDSDAEPPTPDEYDDVPF